MTQPLSPLSPASGNARMHSPIAPPSTVRRRGIDEIMATDNEKENASPNPPKRTLYSYDENYDDDDYYESKYSTARSQYTGVDDATEDLNAGPPSSPFQFDARDDTVDMEKLRAMTTSPLRNKSLRNAVPEVYVDEEDRSDDGRHDDMTSERTYQETEERFESHTVMNNRPLDLDDYSTVHYHAEKSPRHEIGSSMMEDRHNEEMSTVAHPSSRDGLEPDDDALLATESHGMNEHHENDPMDDTCFSTFSAVPNVDMTLFSKLRGSPTKKVGDIMDNSTSIRDSPSSRRSKTSTPTTVRRRAADHSDYSPTPRKRGPLGQEENPDLLDFNDSINYFRRVSQRFSTSNSRASISPRRRSPLKPRESMRSPTKYNLLDFDLPPPQHRCLYLLSPLVNWKISSLKATVSGKEAEVGSLKQAVADAERRVAEALEEVRNEAIRKEALEVEQAEWERRGKEMDTVLREVRSEIIEGERERERMTRRSEEAEKHREELEGRIVELESQLDAARKAPSTVAGPPAGADISGMITAEQSAKEVQEAVERVARELHTLYKGKHENKVAALKKSYESRWEKRVREAENKHKEAAEEIERLKTERDASMSGPIHANVSVLGRDNEELEAENKVLGAQIKGLEQQIASVKQNNEQLHSELKIERAEKGELVAAVDEWLAMQQGQQLQSIPGSREPSVSSTHSSNSLVSEHEVTLQEADLGNGVTIELEADPEPAVLKRSISRTISSSSSGLSGIRPPSSGIEKKSRLGMYHARQNSGSARSGIAMPTPGRSGIMSSIERMGRGGN
ncbi:hypothetical protein BGW36DRAFT_389400 [Talaromyces proteolyticus]|uniref:Uncharacterized protein n=1 Tax=Talaromyces proteolyticus TaxID=1131652 RepID=A0AAD4PSC3_9EURO|nr:uncharacterized protein BGW36DRAFT_389400 [Talaromyces proteolyticus]KAH8690832.1 hypothetical protein BGW36DRAFT_389400 [Talaromyces proteolyticus]